MIWSVKIAYREPTYTQRTHGLRLPYRWTFEVQASSDADARRQALREFRAVERLSSVGWSREVVSVDASPRERGGDA